MTTQSTEELIAEAQEWLSQPVFGIDQSCQMVSKLAGRLSQLSTPQEDEKNLVGAAEAEVGRYVYRRIEALMDAKAGTPDGDELAYLANLAETVEEYGDEHREGHPFGTPAPKLPTPVGGGIAELLGELEQRGIIKHHSNLAWTGGAVPEPSHEEGSWEIVDGLCNDCGGPPHKPSCPEWVEPVGGEVREALDRLSYCANTEVIHYGGPHGMFVDVRVDDLKSVLSAPASGGWVTTDEQIKYMTSRFLMWRLPENFRPDGGISFKAEFNENTAWPMKHEPFGTNLFDAVQAEAMVRHMIDGLPLPASPSPAEEVR